MLIKTSELTGRALRYAVAKAEGHNVGTISAEQQWLQFTDGATPDEMEKRAAVHAGIRAAMKTSLCRIDPDGYKDQHAAKAWCYDTDWAQGGPIIDKLLAEGLILRSGPAGTNDVAVVASLPHPNRFLFGSTALIAAMRCYVASKLGDEIDVPEGLA